MFNLEPDEKVLIVLHHHWMAIVGEVALILLLILIPLAAFPLLTSSERAPALLPLFFFALSLWLLIVLVLAFIFWIDWYLDVLIITTKRVVDIDQDGIFRREVSEFRLDNVQDVTIEIPNFLATMFRYGNLKIQTASEANFSIKEVPRVYEAKDLILKHSRKNVGTFPLGANQT